MGCNTSASDGVHGLESSKKIGSLFETILPTIPTVKLTNLLLINLSIDIFNPLKHDFQCYPM